MDEGRPGYRRYKKERRAETIQSIESTIRALISLVALYHIMDPGVSFSKKKRLTDPACLFNNASILMSSLTHQLMTFLYRLRMVALLSADTAFRCSQDPSVFVSTDMVLVDSPVK